MTAPTLLARIAELEEQTKADRSRIKMLEGVANGAYRIQGEVLVRGVPKEVPWEVTTLAKLSEPHELSDRYWAHYGYGPKGGGQ